jgi:hypothetical protein
MFGIDWSQPETLWLNITNLSLGIVVLVCIAALAYGVLLDVRERVRQRKALAGMDAAVQRIFETEGELHAFHVPHVGLTMADGGEPESQPQNPKSEQRG